MYLIGVDYHPSFQQIAFFVEETGEYGERRLRHEDGEAGRFYRELQQRVTRPTFCTRASERVYTSAQVDLGPHL